MEITSVLDRISKHNCDSGFWFEVQQAVLRQNPKLVGTCCSRLGEMKYCPYCGQKLYYKK